MSAGIALVVGLGNPGQQYQYTRHNAGAMFIERLAAAYKGELRPERKFKGITGRIDIAGHEVHLLFPTTFMNVSGDAVQPFVQFYKLQPEQILVAYDELDLPLGTTRLKVGGGPGGHNGVRDVIRALGSPEFLRLRLGIGHPGDPARVLKYVLGEFNRGDSEIMATEMEKATALMPLLVEGKVPIAMNQLHTRPSPKASAGKPGTSNQQEKTGKTGTANQQEKAGKTGTANQQEKAGKTGTSNEQEKAGKTGTSNEQEKAGKTGTSNEQEKTGTPAIGNKQE